MSYGHEVEDLLRKQIAMLQKELGEASTSERAWWEAAAPYATPNALKEALASRPEERTWIPVGENMPDRFTAVLVAAEISELAPGRVIVVQDTLEWDGHMWASGGGLRYQGKPTHWMRLPQPPMNIGPEKHG